MLVPLPYLELELNSLREDALDALLERVGRRLSGVRPSPPICRGSVVLDEFVLAQSFYQDKVAKLQGTRNPEERLHLLSEALYWVTIAHARKTQVHDPDALRKERERILSDLKGVQQG